MTRALKGFLYRRKSRLTGQALPTWWCCYYAHGKKRRESTETTDRAEARTVLESRIGKVADGKVPTIEIERVTVAYLLDQLALAYADTATPMPEGHVEAWKAAAGRLRARDLTRPALDAILRHWRAHGIREAWSEKDGKVITREARRLRPLTGATCNRYVATLRRAYRLAQETLEGFGYAPRWPHYTETARGKRVTPGDLPRLLAATAGPLADMARLAYDLGPRKGQWRKLQKRNVVLDQAGAVVAIDWTPDQTKAELKHTIAVAAGGESHAILQRLWDGRHVGCAYLFHADPCHERAPEATPCVGDLRSAWKAACKRADLPVGRKHGGYTFKDLRNSFVSDMVDAGEDAAVIASFTGWKNLAMLKRYTTVAERTQRDAIARKNALRPAAPEATVTPMRRKG